MMRDYFDYYFYAIPLRPRLKKAVTVDVRSIILNLNKTRIRIGNLVCHLNDVHAMPLTQAKQEVVSFIKESTGKPYFIGTQRTSEVFISHFKDESRNDKKAKRAAVMYRGFWIDCIDLDPSKF